MKRLFLLIVILVMISTAIPFDVAPTVAQDDGWEVVAMNKQTGQIFTITADGIQSVLAHVMIPDESVTGFVLSPNRQYLAFLNGEYSELLWVYDLETEALVHNILGNPTSFNMQGFRFKMGAFSPDSTKLVVGFDFPPGQDSSDDRLVGGLRILDVSGGLLEIIASIDFTMLNERYPSRITWDDIGILFHLRTYHFQADSQFANSWNPSTNEIDETDQYRTIRSGDEPYNAGTDEMIIPLASYDYPHSGSSGMLGNLPNVLRYFNNAGDFRRMYEVDALPIYYTGLNNETLMTVNWVNDGNGILARIYNAENTNLYIARSGQTIDLSNIIPNEISEALYQSILTNNNSIAPVTDGWLMYHRDSTTLLKFTVTETTIEVTSLGNHANLVFLEYPPQIPDNLIPFATIPPYDWGPVICDGFLPSRLTIGGNGRVTPGPANNLRREPRSDAELIGTIDGGRQFVVLDGPVCDGSVPYWQVDYNGLVGWTAEGSGSDYWLEPQP